MPQDWLKLCNDQGVPLEDFKAQFCDRCLQQDCTRSIAGLSRFEQRTADWQDRLFDNPTRMSPDNPQFERISAQKFISIDTGRVPEVGGSPAQSAWVDPLTLDVEPPSAQKEQVAIAAPELVEPARVDPPEPALVPPPKPLKPLQPMNTPSQSGQMLPGHQAQPKADPKDAWEVPNNPETGDVEIVKPGSRFRFGGSGV